MNPLLTTMWMSLVIVLVSMTILWIIGTVRRDVSLVDLFWGMGFVIIAWTAWGLNSPASSRTWLLVLLTTIWGLRLSSFLAWRNWGKDEDHRYAAMRNYHGQRFGWVSLVTVFLLQGVLMWFISLPQQVAITTPIAPPLGVWDAMGIAIWSLGFIFETVGDWQLARFKSIPSNSNRVMRTGLWRFTRHPNYFGDFCVWWGIYLIAAAGGAWWTIGSPLLMSVLLLKVSGVTLLESTIGDRRPDYAAYQAQTNAFFPWFPASEKGRHEPPVRDQDH
ncbi:DUF1295 domain-containing protein [Schlesneria sp. T3-172]|uniref:DUF1295 domain-containing protein n=1 Tax=Schlesneria TaxID=656899 RepID=UPI002F03242B